MNKYINLTLLSMLFFLSFNIFSEQINWAIPKINFNKIEDALKEHKAAFENFEKEAGNISLSWHGRGYGYFPETKNLYNYFKSLKNLQDVLFTKGLKNSARLGFLLALTCKLLARKADPSDRLLLALSSILLVAPASIIYENKALEKTPYFDILLKKHSNLFDTLSIETFNRTFYSYLSISTTSILTLFLLER